MYLSHKAVIWVVLLVLQYLLSSNFIRIFDFTTLLLYFLFLAWPPMYYSNLLLFPIVHCQSYAWYYTCIIVPNLLTCYLLIYTDT